MVKKKTTKLRTPTIAPKTTYEVRFVERVNGRMHNVEIFQLEEFLSKFADIQQDAIKSYGFWEKLKRNYGISVVITTRNKFRLWFFDRLARNLNRKK